MSEARKHAHQVLVVEDDPTGRYSITIALEKKDIDVIVAEDGAEGLQWLKTHDFCAIVLDLVMPKVDGYAVIRHILDNKPDLPIIVVTGLKADELSGVDRRVVVDVLFKPFRAAELAARILEICSKPAAEQKNS